MSANLFGQCEKFDNYPLGAEQGKEVHFYCREHIKKGNYLEALPYWRKLYAHVPAGSEYHYMDGIRIYEYLIKKEDDETKTAAYRDTLWMLYDGRVECFGNTPKKKGNILTRKAYAMYKQEVTFDKIYPTLSEGIALAGNKTKHFTLYPFAYVTVEQFKAGKITSVQAQETYAALMTIATHHSENGKTEKDIFKYSEAKEKIEKLFNKKLDPPIFDCEYYSKIYVPQYEANPDDVDTYRAVYKALKKGQCPEAMPLLVEIYTKDSIRRAIEKEEAFAAARAAAPKSKKAIWEYENGNYEKSAELFVEGAAEETEQDAAAKADMCFKAAQIAFANLKDFPKARDYALKALEYRPNWGKPYLLIGDLYASSGPKCGSGTGFNSQVVTWVAIDMWKKAKTVDKDPFVVEKANKQIKKYAKFMPTNEDLHVRGLKSGQSYTVKCWIQRKTTIRTSTNFRP